MPLSASEFTIVSIVSDALRPDRVRVRVGDDVYTLDVLLVARLGLREGQILTPEKLHELQTESALTAAKERALNLLSHRAFTKSELASRLAQNEYAPDCVERVIAWLVDLGYLDDGAYANQWVQQRMESKGLGPVRLRHELSRKGVDPSLIQQALESFTDEDLLEIAYQQAKKRLNREGDMKDPKVRNRLYGFLQRRGFTSSVIRQVMRQISD